MIKFDAKTIVAKPTDSYRYPEDTPAGKLERHMKISILVSIVSLQTREKYKMENGDIRSASMEISPRDRAERTQWIKELKIVEMEKIHDYEQKKMTRFLFIAEAEKILKLKIARVKFNPPVIDNLESFNNIHRPQCGTFQEFVIPPYFVDDLDFDGMNYHHAWDKCIWYADYLPDMFFSQDDGFAKLKKFV